MKYEIPVVKHMTKLQKIIAAVLLALLLTTTVATFLDWRPLFFGAGDFPDLQAETLASKVQAGFPEVPLADFSVKEIELVVETPNFLKETPVSLKDVEEL